jgi:uncharacterized protein (DUF488 family)
MTIWTVGHSNRSIEEFINLLKAHRIELLADVRRHPGSRRLPWFNSPALAASLRVANIDYIQLPELGGRRKPAPDSPNTAWRNESFRGYADYMQTSEFAKALARLEQLARAHRTAIMCAEVLWWQCHRALIADALKVRGWLVLHIQTPDKDPQGHPYTSAAKILDGKLSYQGNPADAPGLFG